MGGGRGGVKAGAGEGFGSSREWARKGPGGADPGGLAPKDALLQALDEVSQASGREAQDGGNTGVLGPDSTPESWEELDAKVNDYPIQRKFQVIGEAEGATGGGGVPGEAFQADVVAAVAGVLGPVPPGLISRRPSRGGKYVSVRVGPLEVASREDLEAVFRVIKADARVKWVL